MPDMEKVIKGLEELHGSQEMMTLISETIALLKEQEDMGKELTDAMELVHKKNARIIELIDLLKEQEEQKRKWMQAIADTQLAKAPNDSDIGSLDEQIVQRI